MAEGLTRTAPNRNHNLEERQKARESFGARGEKITS